MQENQKKLEEKERLLYNKSEENQENEENKINQELELQENIEAESAHLECEEIQENVE